MGGLGLSPVRGSRDNRAMKPTIFVVEDQKELRESICEELDRSGYSTVGASHGERALTLLHRSATRPSLILLDLLMPEKDGWEVVASVKADPTLRSVPIVVMTLANGSRVTYLPRADTYGKGLYQESIAILAPGSLERVIEVVGEQIAAWSG